MRRSTTKALTASTFAASLILLCGCGEDAGSPLLPEAENVDGGTGGLLPVDPQGDPQNNSLPLPGDSSNTTDSLAPGQTIVDQFTLNCFDVDSYLGQANAVVNLSGFQANAICPLELDLDMLQTQCETAVQYMFDVPSCTVSLNWERCMFLDRFQFELRAPPGASITARGSRLDSLGQEICSYDSIGGADLEGSFTCDTFTMGRRIPLCRRCDDLSDCMDGSDENNCTDMVSIPCTTP